MTKKSNSIPVPLTKIQNRINRLERTHDKMWSTFHLQDWLKRICAEYNHICTFIISIQQHIQQLYYINKNIVLQRLAISTA